MSHFISPVGSLAIVEPCISICQVSHATEANENHVTSVNVELFVTTKSLASFTAKSQ